MFVSAKNLLSGSILSAMLALASACSSNPSPMIPEKPLCFYQPGNSIYFFEDFSNYDDHLPGITDQTGLWRRNDTIWSPRATLESTLKAEDQPRMLYDGYVMLPGISVFDCSLEFCLKGLQPLHNKYFYHRQVSLCKHQKKLCFYPMCFHR